MAKEKVQAWSVAADKILERKLKANMPQPMQDQIIEEARLQGIRDVFGAGVTFDSCGRPQESGIGSDLWYQQATEGEVAGALSAVERFEGKSAATAVRERVNRLRGKK